MLTEPGFTKVVFTIENRGELDCILNALDIYSYKNSTGSRLVLDRTIAKNHDVADLAERLRVAIAEAAGL